MNCSKQRHGAGARAHSLSGHWSWGGASCGNLDNSSGTDEEENSDQENTAGTHTHETRLASLLLLHAED